MTSVGFALFETALGRCAIAWNERGIAGVQLPEGDDARTRARIRRRFARAREEMPPPAIERVIASVAALLAGRAIDLSAVVLDMDRLQDFDRRVYAITRTIPAGATLTYGEVAARLGDGRLARAVGQALARNPFAIVVPCHRVLAAHGALGGFSAGGGATTKRRMLMIEGAGGGAGPGLFDDLRQG